MMMFDIAISSKNKSVSLEGHNHYALLTKTLISQVSGMDGNSPMKLKEPKDL